MFGKAAFGLSNERDDKNKAKRKNKSPFAREPEFKDFNNAWGNNNDHNWEADGDTKWDQHDGM